ncbi:unnamed protein product [Brachionus calyciflorus]|uniref:Alpha-type protein kinase domain-containing protein n=1 Tax=Brachionus calyciflorus TaxID=104777 RepID=A0A814GJS5_9BILA|nr:unnamed protein product [Brachionus calyciflorus]
MFSIKLFKFDSNDSFFIQADSLDDLKKKASVKLEKKVEKLIRHEDFIEIDEEDVFQELVKICDNSKREYLTLIAIDDKSHLDTRLINSETNRILNEIKSNKSRVRELQVVLEEDENTEHTNENNQKLENLKKEYNKLIFETIATKTYDQKDIQKLENKLNLLKNKQNDLNELFSRLRFTEKVDFCFLIDCTSSMSTYIEQVHDSINDIIDQIYSKYGRIQIRFSYVGYRDFSELDNRILSVPFLEDIELFKTFLGEIITYGGEDECEDVFGGLLEATKLDWSSPVRILFHLCDAPCHGLRFHTNCEDLYPKGDPLGLEIKNLLSSLHKLNINYYFAQISPTTLKMIEEFNKELPQFQIKSLKLSKNMTGLVAQTIQESILKTSRLNGSNNVIKVRELNAPDWSSLKGFKKYNADYFTAVYLKNFEQIRECLTFEKHNPVVWIGENPFSQGVLRYAYPCVVDMGDIDNECYLNCVIKESVYSNPEFNTRKFHEDNIQVQLIASFLAHKFTQLNSEFKIRFLEVDLIRVHETGVYYSIEEFSEGEFKKWMNNEGNLNQEENVDVLCAFSHWTYQATDEYLMITDLQGFSFRDKEFILTDPAIICSSEPNRFGKTNLAIIKEKLTTDKTDAKIAEEFNVERSTVTKIFQRKDKYLNLADEEATQKIKNSTRLFFITRRSLIQMVFILWYIC